jgi:uncharacterized protein
MNRYIVYLQNTASRHTPKDANVMLLKARKLIEPNAIVRDVRISKKYIELDISTSDALDISTAIRSLETLSKLDSYRHITERHMEKDKAIQIAMELFNEEKYWEAHETLEYVWKNSSGIEKQILNGIILVAAAFVHEEKNETDVCLSILERAKKKLEEQGSYKGIDIYRLVNMISEIIKSGNVERFKLGVVTSSK